MTTNVETTGFKVMSRQLAGLRQAGHDAAEGVEKNHRLLQLVAWSLVVIAVIAVIAALHAARFVAIPVVAGIIIGLIMGPVGDRGKAFRVPKAITFAFLIILMLAAVGLIAWLALPIMQVAVSALPQAIHRFHGFLDFIQRWLSTFDQLKGAGSGLPVNFGTPPAPAPPAGPDPVGLAKSALSFMTPAVSQIFIFLFSLVLFLASRSYWRQTVARLFADRENRLKALKRHSAIENRLTDFFLVVTAINAGFGLCVGLLFWAVGIPAAFSWAALAFLLNFLPVVGPLFMKVLLITFGLLLYPDLAHAFLPFGLFLVISLIEANLVTPKIVGSRLTVDPFAVFLSVVVLTWLWGFAGAFLAMPLLAIAAAVTEPQDSTGKLPA